MIVSSDLCSSWCKQYNQADGELASSSQDDTNDAGHKTTLGSQQQIAVVSAAVGEPNSEAATATAAWFTAVM